MWLAEKTALIEIREVRSGMGLVINFDAIMQIIILLIPREQPGGLPLLEEGQCLVLLDLS